jgi:hypothetical protein
MSDADLRSRLLRFMKENARRSNGARLPYGYSAFIVEQRGASIAKKVTVDVVEVVWQVACASPLL